MDVEEMAKLVSEMRRLGVKSYKSGDVELHLGDAPVEVTEKTEREQQMIRDRREREVLDRRNRLLFGAASSIGPEVPRVK